MPINPNPEANFTPPLKGYSGQGAFRFWCQTVLPIVYDDSLSYYELLNKVVNYLNNTISDVANVEDNVNSLYVAYNQLQDYVNNYFDNLDVQTEINNKLDNMVESGEFDELLSPVVATQIGGVVGEQIDTAVAGQIDNAVAEQIDDVVAEQIAAPVATNTYQWLNAHVTPVGSAVVVDDTLTIQGAAADAKTTGDYIRQIQPLATNAMKIINGTIPKESKENVSYAEFDTDGIYPLNELDISIVATQSGSGDPSPTNYRAINGYNSINVYVSPTLNSEDATVTNIPLPSDPVIGGGIYGGSLNVNTGILKVTHRCRDLGSINWALVQAQQTSYWAATLYGSQPFSDVNNIAPILCSSFKPDTQTHVYYHTNDNIVAQQANAINIYGSTYMNMTATEFKTAVTGMYVLFPLATPLEFELSETEINTLTGKNYIWVNSGNIINIGYFISVEDYVNKQISGKTILRLPPKIDTVENDSFELFYKGISNTIDSNAYEYDIEISPSISAQKGWKRKFTATPNNSNIGEHTMTINVINNSGDVVDTQATTINVNATPTSPATEQVILCVGDSLTTSGSWCHELDRRLTGSGGSPTGLGLNNITFIGNQSYSGTRYEGYGGYTFTSYTTENLNNDNMIITCEHDKTEALDQHSIYKDTNNCQWKLETIELTQIKIIRVSGSALLPTSGTLTWVSGGTNHSDITYTNSVQASGNPFWNNSLNKNDFVSYASQFGVNQIDNCIILLGWNNTATSKTAYKNQAKAFINSLLNDFPNCKITLLGLQVPSQNGMAQNYGLSWKYFSKLQHVWKVQEVYEELLSEYENADYVCVSAQFDTEYNCITNNMNVNLRNTTTVAIQTNAVHPAPSGYLQIADAVYRNVCGRL